MSSEPFSISLIVERLQPLTPEPLSFLGTIVEYSRDGTVRICGPRRVCSDGA